MADRGIETLGVHCDNETADEGRVDRVVIFHGAVTDVARYHFLKTLAFGRGQWSGVLHVTR